MANNSQDPIEVRGLTKSFKKLKVLKGIDLAVKKGTVLALLGPNGAGKTTMVRIMSTLLLPDSGKITIGGYDVVKDADEVRSVIGLTGQTAAVDEYLTGAENMEMMGRLYRLSVADSRRRGKELLRQFELSDAKNRVVRNYSGGMRRRLDLAVSLIATPPILFLDEPTTGLDPRSRLTMWEIIEQLAATGTTILLTTQYMEEADRLADKITVIDEGKVIAEGTSDQLKQKIGKERLEIVIAKESNFDKAKSVLGDGITEDEKQRTLNVSMYGGFAQVKEILSKLEGANINVESFSLHKPTLDDVFLTLTGHATTDKGSENEQEKAEAR